MKKLGEDIEILDLVIAFEAILIAVLLCLSVTATLLNT